MYKRAYGIIETLAPLHVGSTAGEETGNLNLIFRNQLTQTGIVPGSSIRGRLRADLVYRSRVKFLEDKHSDQEALNKATEAANDWYGRAAESSRNENYDYESVIKIEYASIVWLPVFCPGQPIVWVSCPRLLERYKRIANIEKNVPEPYTSSQDLKGRKLTKSKNEGKELLFFNLGFLTLEKPKQDLSVWFPFNKSLPAVVVDDNDMGMIHDMALYRQSRVALEDTQKIVADKAFFNIEALPEGTILSFPIGMKTENAMKKTWQNWQPLEDGKKGNIYLGGLESVGFGHCYMEIKE